MGTFSSTTFECVRFDTAEVSRFPKSAKTIVAAMCGAAGPGVEVRACRFYQAKPNATTRLLLICEVF